MVRRRIRYYWRRGRRFVYHSILHADDPPHRLAMALAIAMFITFTPTVGFQMVMVVFLTWLLRANKLVGVPVVWISNPATIVPIYYVCYLIGRMLMGSEPVAENWQWWQQLPYPPSGWWPKVTFYWDRFMQILPQLCVGGVVVGLATAIPTYYVSYFGIRAYRMKRWGQLVPPSASRSSTLSTPPVPSEPSEQDAASGQGESASEGASEGAHPERLNT